MQYDLAIIGGGPAGYNAASRASENGLHTVLFEKNAIGGVCLNEGCIPTKTLLYSAKIYDTVKNASKYGIQVNGNPDFDIRKIMSRKDKVVKKLTGGVKMKLTAGGVDIVQGIAFIAGEQENRFRILCNDTEYLVSYILLCTGSETVVPPIKGLQESGFWTSKEALEIEKMPESVAIIGGGVIGIEFASFFNSMGVKVSVIEMLPEILGNMDNETSGMLRKEYTKRGISFYLGTKVTEVSKNSVTIEKEGKTSVLETAQILLSAGRKAITQNLGLENIRVEILRNGVSVNEYMQTSHPRVYAAGDITGFSMLAHTAIREGEVAVNHLLGIDDKISYKAIPSVVYTNPEIAGVGKTEEELQSAGENYRVLKLPMAYAGRFVAENEAENGICKLIINQEDQIIGCHMLGNPASELILIAGIAIDKGYTVEDFRKQVFPHPTTGEIIREILFI